MDLEIFFGLSLVVGAITGICAGLLGVGGGLLYVPALLFLLPKQGVADAILMHVAVASSLATIVVTSMSSLISHARLHGVIWDYVRWLSLGIVPGAFIGTMSARYIDGVTLRMIYGAFAVLVGVKMAFGWSPTASRPRPMPLAMSAAGAGIGMISAWLGIGGGTLTTPYLVWRSTPIREAIGTSAACGFPIAFVAAMSYGLLNPETIPGGMRVAGLTGLLYWPAIIPLMLGSMLGAGYGARLTHSVPVERLRRGFALLLIALGVAVWLKL
ncbi:MAG: TSUP family transporter [Gammaproteobacteria bacterium]|nr:TSUP family transporter [Gammaproteobacteria bacterium]